MARLDAKAGCQGPFGLQRGDAQPFASGQAVHPAWRPGSIQDELHRDEPLIMDQVRCMIVACERNYRAGSVVIERSCGTAQLLKVFVMK